MPARSFSRVDLPEPFGPDDAERLPAGTSKETLVERRHALTAGGARPARREERRLERAVRPPRVAPVELRRLAHGDGRLRAHASSARRIPQRFEQGARRPPGRRPPSRPSTATSAAADRAEEEERVVHRLEVAGEGIGSQEPAEAPRAPLRRDTGRASGRTSASAGCRRCRARRRSGPRAPKRREPGRKRRAVRSARTSGNCRIADPGATRPSPAATAIAAASTGRARPRCASRARTAAAGNTSGATIVLRSSGPLARNVSTASESDEDTKAQTSTPPKRKSAYGSTSARGAKTQRKTVA